MRLSRASPPAGWFPKRGQVCLFALDKTRPAVVVSSDALNRHSLDVCVVPISTAEHKAYSLRPKLLAGDGGLDRNSWVKCDQVTTVLKTAAVYPPLGGLSQASLERVGQAIKQALELP